MKVYTQLAKYPTFTISDVQKLVGNQKTAYSQLDRLMKNQLIKKIRKNLYSTINPTTGQVVATRYQIACAITDTAYISHHSAFEYYGLANQVFYEMYVSSNTRFNTFEYDNITYKYVASKIRNGIIEVKNTTGVIITDLERTVIDSIWRINKIGGFEELINCIEGIQYLDEDKLRCYLDSYNIKGLYQKAGYLLNIYRENLQISDKFINYCKEKIGNSIRYLVSGMKDNSYFNKEWRLMLPKGNLENIEHGGDLLV